MPLVQGRNHDLANQKCIVSGLGSKRILSRDDNRNPAAKIAAEDGQSRMGRLSRRARRETLPWLVSSPIASPFVQRGPAYLPESVEAFGFGQVLLKVQ